MPRTEGKNYHLHNIFGSLEKSNSIPFADDFIELVNKYND